MSKGAATGVGIKRAVLTQPLRAERLQAIGLAFHNEATQHCQQQHYIAEHLGHGMGQLERMNGFGVPSGDRFRDLTGEKIGSKQDAAPTADPADQQRIPSKVWKQCQ